MAYLLVEDFKFGMDRRRKRVAGTPGTLWIGKNVHVTRGGDIERRKKFVPEYHVAGTFGCATLRSQLYVFGSADLAASMPIGVQYHRLVAPSSPVMLGVLAVKGIDQRACFGGPEKFRVRLMILMKEALEELFVGQARDTLPALDRPGQSDR